VKLQNEKNARFLSNPAMQMEGKCALLLVVGSRGDLNPFLALGEELDARGWRVRIATHGMFCDVVQRFGFDFWDLGGDSKALMRLMSGSDQFGTPTFMFRSFHAFRDMVREILERSWLCVNEYPSGVGHFDLIVGNPVSFVAIHLAEFLKVPCVMLFTMPWTRSKEFPFPLFMSHRGPIRSPFNPSSFGLFETTIWWAVADLVNEFRVNKLKLRKLAFYEAEVASSNMELHGRQVPFIYAWSELVMPKPADWGAHITISGYLVTRAERDSILQIHQEKRWGGFETSDQIWKFVEETSDLDVLGPLFIGFGSINAPESEMEIFVSNLVQALHFLACMTDSRGKIGLPGARRIIIQSSNHQSIFDRELENRTNMCTVAKGGITIFQNRKPLMKTTAGTIKKSSSVNDLQLRGDPALSNLFWLSNKEESSKKDDIFSFHSGPRKRSRSSISAAEAEAVFDHLRENILIIDEAKHSELFPKCSAVVHHGGAGTFMTCLHAGTPQLIMPFFGDQFLWGDVAKRRGVGTVLPPSSSTSKAIAKAFKTCIDLSPCASKVGEEMRDELKTSFGPSKAVDAIESWFDEYPACSAISKNE